MANPSSRRIRFPPSSTSGTGHFHDSLTAFSAPPLHRPHPTAAEIEAEARAQIHLLQSTGLHLTHIDTHKHTHVFPARAPSRPPRRPLLRHSRHPQSIRAVLGRPRHHGARPMRLAQVTLLCVARDPPAAASSLQEGFATTDGTIAVAGTGILDAATLRSLLQKLPSGTWELVTHPGYNDADLAHIQTRLRASREVERQALHAIREFPSIQLVSFANLQAHQTLSA